MAGASLSESLHRLMHAYKSGLRCAIQREEMSMPITHVRTLKGVCFMTECTVQAIARRMQRDKAQITRVVNELQADGLISKADNPRDRRSQLLCPTAKGEQLMQRMQAIEHETAARMLGTLSQTDIDTFVRLANTMADNLCGPCLSRHPADTGDAPHG